ncbi:MAG: phosphatase PAP2 family protein [Ignavibacteria bacterium]|nr:phosphatase PAP2 family protein [Ignavibacteria bacterium]
MKKNFRNNRFIYTSALLFVALLALLVFTFPLGFSSYRNTDSLAPFWYFVTESGGFIGSILIVAALSAYLYFHFRTSGKRMRYLAEFIGFLIFIELATLALSQLYTKEIVREPRPSQLYFVEKGVIENGGKEFFTMPMKEKEVYLRQRTELRISEFSDVYPPILSSWSGDTTFSFPSGHAQSSFFLGTAMAFIVYNVVPRRKRYLALIPLSWALLVSLSRVVIGVHFPVDVTAGAIAGAAFALMLISSRISARAIRRTA